MEVEKVVVIGASAGGLKAVYQLVSNLPPELPLAIFVVIHMSKHSQPDIIVQQLQKLTSYKCAVAANGQDIQLGCLYLAPADSHLLVKRGKMVLGHGPHENRWRPSINVMFRSAAAAYGSEVTGIILSGLLDDGTSGMAAIKRCGGMCIVQEPAEAEYMDMPVNVINNVQVDHRVLVQDMGYIIADVLSKPARNLPVPEDIMLEAEITERMASSITNMEKIATHSNFTCPDCGGGLWKITNEKFGRYRCHTGHVYTDEVLLEKQNEQMEESVWISIRMIEERRNLLLNLISHDRTENTAITRDYQARADELGVHVERLKALLVTMNKHESKDEGYL
jgi:two-component system chemotaxis response regulator CheB